MGFKKLCFDFGIDIQLFLFFIGIIFDGKRNICICIGIYDDVYYFFYFELSYYFIFMNFRLLMLDNFVLLFGQLNILGKFFRNEKVLLLRNFILLLIVLSGDRDLELEVKRFYLILMFGNVYNFNIFCGVKFDRNRKFVNLFNSYFFYILYLLVVYVMVVMCFLLNCFVRWLIFVFYQDLLIIILQRYKFY